MKKYNKKKTLSASNTSKVSESELVKHPKKKGFLSVVSDVLFYGIMSIAMVVNVRHIVAYSKNYIKNNDIIPDVANELSVDMSIMQNKDFNYEIVKLKPNSNNKVYVCVDNKVPERTQKNIISSLKYFNDLFDDINDKYNFELCDKATYIANYAMANSTVYFDYKNTGNFVYGLAERNCNKPLILKAFSEDAYYSNVYNLRSTIYLSSQYFDKLTDSTQESIIRHELLHIFGLEDTYTGFKEEASLLNVDYTTVINKVSPKDLARLYILYDEALIEGGNKINQTELARVKERILNYEKEYYGDLVAILKDELGKTDYKPITNSDLERYSIAVNGMVITIDQDGQFTYVSATGDKVTRSIIRGSNYVVLPDIRNGDYEDFYVLLKDENGIKTYNLEVNGGVRDDKATSSSNNGFEIS